MTECFKAIHAGKNEAKKLKNAIAGANSEGERVVLKRKLEEIQIILFVNKNMARILKTIVDGIVWRNFNFDRPVLRLMASNRKTGFIDINEPGFVGVIKISKSIMWDRKSIAIINDLSNFLRVGDLTEITKDGIFIYEIKARGRIIRNMFSLLKGIDRLSEISNQTARLLKVQAAITYRKIYLDSTRIVHIRNSKAPFKHFIGNVNKIVLRARKEGFCSEKIADYLVVSCLDLLQSVKLAREGKIKDITSFRAVEDWEDDDFIIPFSNTYSFYKNEDFFNPNQTPYSVFPFASKTCFELLSGRLILTARINISKVFRYFEENGWTVDEISEDEILKRARKIKSLYPDVSEAYNYDETLCTLKRGEFNLAIPGTWIFRIGMDFMSAETILLEAEDFYNREVPANNELVALNYLKERPVWR